MKGVEVLRIHYTADPEKADPRWAEAMKEGYPTDKWAREMDMNAHAGLGLAIYGREYRPDKHERSLEPHPSVPMGHGWDFGEGAPAKVWVQRTRENGVRVLAEQWREHMQLRPFTEQAIAFEINVLGGPYQNRRDYCDPAGNANKDDGLKSIEVLKEFGYRPRWRGSEYSERHEYLSRLLLAHQLDGEPMLLIDPQRCPQLCEAFRSRYRRDKGGDPLREHPFIDLMNALEYYLVNTKSPSAGRRQPPPDVSLINEVSGYGPWGLASTAAARSGEDRLVVDPIGGTARYERGLVRSGHRVEAS